MPGEYCRGCGKSIQELKVKHPKECRQCGPLVRAARKYCEWCGSDLSNVRKHICQNGKS